LRRTAAGETWISSVSARRGEPGGQRRRGHAGLLVKTLYIATQAGVAETVEVGGRDSGAGVSSDDKEKLFLLLSTKNRGTDWGWRLSATS
jgi:hypothetical protein